MILKAFSKALYSSWYYYSPDRLLFDCGEGCALNLKQEIFAIEKIFISHGHMDHISGILSFLCLRQSTKGDTEKGIDIFYPQGDRSIEILIKTVKDMLGSYLKYKLTWHPLNPGDRVQLKKGRFMECHQADHGTENPLVFLIKENRKSLKESLRGRPGRELAQLADDDKYDFHEAIVLAYSGDSMPLKAELYKNASILIHECTFLKASDRKWPIHSEVQEVFNLAKEAQVKRLILTHISPRYFNHKIDPLVEKVNQHDINFDIIYPDKVNCFD